MRRLLAITLAAAASNLGAASPDTIYAIARVSPPDPGSPGYYLNAYVVGSFDLANPAGAPGSYSYTWTSLGSPTTEALTNIVRNPLNGQLYLQYGFYQYRTVSASGTIGGTSLGTGPAYFGMAFDASGNLHAIDGYDFAVRALDPATGVGTTFEMVNFEPYSQFGGGLAALGNTLYFANFGFDTGVYGELLQVDPATGASQRRGIFSGQGYDPMDWMSLFASGSGLYLLNADRLYQVDPANAALTRLGTVTDLPFADMYGFAGAVGNFGTIPEPSTYGLGLAGLALVTAAIRRRRKA